MHIFKSLPIFYKIISILAIAVLSFIINLLINLNAITENRQLLMTIQNTTIHLVNITSANVNTWKYIDDTYSQSVSFGDEDLIEQADVLVNELQVQLDKINALDNQFTDTDTLNNQITEYNEISKSMSIGFINDEIDFTSESFQNDVQKKSQIFEEVSKTLLLDQQISATLFNHIIESTITNSDDSTNLSILAGVALLVFMSLLSIIIARSISHSIITIDSSLKELAEGDGDLTNQIRLSRQDELGGVVNNFNAFTQILRGIVVEVVDVISPLTQSAEKLSQQVKDVYTNIQRQIDVAEVTKQSMTEMQSSVTNIKQSAAEAANAAESGESEVNIGMNNVQQSLLISGELVQGISQAADVVDHLAKNSQDMNQILDVINSIAEQTNLLALNAAIEAARAGEQGRGFAVVADEVRNLASRTALSTTEIRELLSKLITAADQSVLTMGEAREKANQNEEIARDVDTSLTKIKDQIGFISSMNSQIATATEEQSYVTESVVDSIEKVYVSFDETKKSIEEIDSVSKLLDSNAGKLQITSSKFKV